MYFKSVVVEKVEKDDFFLNDSLFLTYYETNEEKIFLNVLEDHMELNR